MANKRILLRLARNYYCRQLSQSSSLSSQRLSKHEIPSVRYLMQENSWSANSNQSSYRQMWVSAVACLGFTFLTSKAVVYASEKEDRPSTLKIDRRTEEEIIEKADALYSQHQVDQLYDFLKEYSEVESAQIGWRQARAACDKAKHCEPKSAERQALMREGFKYAEKSIAADRQCGPCHRWYALMLNYVGDYEGNKEKIKYSYIVQEHFQEAVKLDPKDATSMYCLGEWCYFFADMSWYTQKIAALIFGTPPTSTFQEALDYFTLAETTDPDFYSMNHVMLAKTYIKLNNKVKAKEHLLRARDLPVKSPDDKEAHALSIELLTKLQN